MIVAFNLTRIYSFIEIHNLVKTTDQLSYFDFITKSYLYPPHFKFLSAWFWGFPEQNKDFAIMTYGGGPSLIRYSSNTAEQNFMKLSGIVHYMMPYCTSNFKFLFEWFWGFPEQNKDFAIQNMWELGVSFYEHCSQYF